MASKMSQIGEVGVGRGVVALASKMSQTDLYAF